MKKNLFLVVLMAVAVASQAQNAQKNALKINPLSLLVKTGNVAYERVVGQRTSVQLGAFYSGVSLGDFRYDGYGITPEFRYYFGGRKEALNGGYVAPFGRYQRFTIAHKDTKEAAGFSTVGGGAVMGWQRHWTSGFTLDLFAGPSFNQVQFKDGSEEDFEIEGGIKGFGLRTGVTLGFSF